MTQGEPLFRGRTAEIHRVDDDHVVKLYARGEPIERARREFHNQQTAADLGVRVPTVGDVVTMDGRHGFTMALAAGDTLMDRLGAGAVDVHAGAVQLAELQASITAKTGSGLERHRAIVTRRVEGCERLSGAERNDLLERLQGLPDGDALCHGDFHPRNIILDGDIPTIIDWIDASSGPPAADLARSAILFLGHHAITEPGPELESMESFHATYMDTVLDRTVCGRGELESWLPILAAARLSENAWEFEEFLLDTARNV